MGYHSSDHRNILTAGVAIQRGHLTDLRGDIHFAHNSAVGNTYETVWETGGLYPWPDAARTLVVTSSSGATDAGVQVYINGLLADWTEHTETVTLNASGTATTTQSFLRVNHSGIAGVTEPAGNIAITNDGDTISEIIFNDNTSLKSVYSVPAGHNAYIMSAFISIDKNNDMRARMRLRTAGGVWQTAGIVSVFGSSFSRDFQIPPMLPPQTDFEIQARCGNNSGVSAGFELILERI